MKQIVTLLSMLLLSSGLCAQQGINYKALVKDDLGNVIANQVIDVQLVIFKDVDDVVYEELHHPTTDDNGIIILVIGQGDITGNGLFSEINWGDDNYFLNVKIDTGSGFQDMGNTQFNAVPYALQAETSKYAEANAYVTYPPYIDVNYSDFNIISGGRISFTIEFNIKINPTSVVLGDNFLVFGSGGSATGTIAWLNGGTRMRFTSNESFTSLAPCFSGGLQVQLKGNGVNKVLDINNKPIDGDRDGRSGGNFVVFFDIVC